MRSTKNDRNRWKKLALNKPQDLDSRDQKHHSFGNRETYRGVLASASDYGRVLSFSTCFRGFPQYFCRYRLRWKWKAIDYETLGGGKTALCPFPGNYPSEHIALNCKLLTSSVYTGVFLGRTLPTKTALQISSPFTDWRYVSASKLWMQWRWSLSPGK